MRDAYGTRYGLIARFGYPRARDQHVLLLDVDTSAFIVLADVGVFDDVERAATAWRATVGDPAENTQPEPVTDPDQLMCLVHVDPSDEFGVRGDEPRSVVDNWFRADRRIHELHYALRKRRIPLPPSTNLFRDVDITLMTVPFVEWYMGVLVPERIEFWHDRTDRLHRRLGYRRADDQWTARRARALSARRPVRAT